ncbi:MAG: hypothetical protein ACRC5T_01020 [Cetobacterium sp.]
MKNKNEILQGGIDTLDLRFKGNIDVESLKDISIMKSKCSNYSNKDGESFTKLAIKPTIGHKNKNELSSIATSLKVIQEVKNEIMNEYGVVDEPNLIRVDISSNMSGGMEENENLFKAFLYCLLLRRNMSFELYKTNKDNAKYNKINIRGNYKIKNGGTETTIYNKDLEGSRIENRKLKVEHTCSHKETFERVQAHFITEITGLEGELLGVEDFLASSLYKEYLIDVEKRGINFSKFIYWADKEGFLVSKRVVEKLLILVGKTTNINNFVEAYRRSNKGSLKFITKFDIKNMTKDIIKSFKNKNR